MTDKQQSPAHDPFADWVTVKELVQFDYVTASASAVYAAIKDDQVQHVKRGRTTFVFLPSVREWQKLLPQPKTKQPTNRELLEHVIAGMEAQAQILASIHEAVAAGPASGQADVDALAEELASGAQ